MAVDAATGFLLWLKTVPDLGAGEARAIAVALALIFRVEALPWVPTRISTRDSYIQHNCQSSHAICVLPDGLVEMFLRAANNEALTWSFPQPQEDKETLLATLTGYSE